MILIFLLLLLLLLLTPQFIRSEVQPDLQPVPTPRQGTVRQSCSRFAAGVRASFRQHTPKRGVFSCFVMGASLRNQSLPPSGSIILLSKKPPGGNLRFAKWAEFVVANPRNDRLDLDCYGSSHHSLKVHIPSNCHVQLVDSQTLSFTWWFIVSSFYLFVKKSKSLTDLSMQKKTTKKEKKLRTPIGLDESRTNTWELGSKKSRS